MCLQHPCYESLNRFAASKPVRIIFGVLLVIVVAFGCYRLLQASNDLQASKNAKLLMIPEVDDNLIHFTPIEESSYKKLTSKIDEVADYYKKGRSRNVIYCNDGTVQSDKICDVDWKDFGPCAQENLYGYYRAKPCVFLKLKRTRDWIPQFVNRTELPENFPAELKDVVNSDENHNKRAIWFSCQGENPADLENIGPISFYPSAGIPGYYFPWKGQEDYLDPLIAISFEKPTRGVTIFVKCTMWTQDVQESITFELLID